MCFLGEKMKEKIQILILAGGKGTRLSSVVSDRPKPMALIKETPFLECMIKRFKSMGYTNFCLLTGYMHEFIENYFKENPIEGVQIGYSVESKPLGTGGALSQSLYDAACDYYVCLNGDSYFGFSEEELSDCISEIDADPNKFIIGLKRMDDPERYGVVRLDKAGKILGFEEKGSVQGTAFINSGVYIFSKSIKNRMTGDDFSLENEVFPRLIEEGILYGHELKGDFIDIGIPEDYDKAQNLIPTEY